MDENVSTFIKSELSSLFVSQQDINSVDARKLWVFLDSKQQFADWIKNRLQDFDLNIDYMFHKVTKAGNNNNITTIDYILTLETAKHIAMLEVIL